MIWTIFPYDILKIEVIFVKKARCKAIFFHSLCFVTSSFFEISDFCSQFLTLAFFSKPKSYSRYKYGADGQELARIFGVHTVFRNRFASDRCGTVTCEYDLNSKL